MREDYQRFQEAGGSVVVVTMSKPEQLRPFREHYRLPFPLLSDTGQEAYRAFHVPRGGILSVAGPAMWGAGAVSVLRHGVGWVAGDPYQLPGSFVIDINGTIRLAHYSKNSADLPTNEALLSAVEDAARVTSSPAK